MNQEFRNNHVLKKISYEAIAEKIAVVDGIDRQETDFSEIRKLIGSIFVGYGCLTRIVNCERGWRARKNCGNVFFDNIKQLWYPPAHLIAYFGRMNQPNSPMFYVSASRDIALLELRPIPGDLITVLEVRLFDREKSPHVMEIGVAEKVSQHSLGRDVKILENTSFGRSFLGDEIKKNLLIRNFLAKEVTRSVGSEDKWHFKVTAAIAGNLLASREIDGILYPSIAGDGLASKGGQNLALKPLAADRLFQPVACFAVRVIEWVSEPSPGWLVECVGEAKEVTLDGCIRWM